MVEFYTKNQETNHSLEGDKAEVLSDSKKGQKEVNSSIEYNIAKEKFKKFMSNGDDSSEISDEEMSLYHFDTVNWWVNRKPHPKMVIEEINTLDDYLQKTFKEDLMKEPADVLFLQKQLNELLNCEWWIDVNRLKRLLDGTGMELEYRPNEELFKYRIKEDWMLGPQTFAVLCCFEKKHRKTTTTNSYRWTKER